MKQVTIVVRPLESFQSCIMKRRAKVRPTVMWHNLSCFMLAVAICLTGCKNQKNSERFEAEQVEQTKRIVTESYALQYFAKRIAGESYEVEFPAENAGSPKDWSPKVADVAAIQKADLIVINGPGAEYGKWLTRVTLPASKICNTCEGFELKEYIQVNDYQIVHSHGPEGEHSHPYFVAFPWLDPNIAVKQAEAVRDVLVKTYPQDKDKFESNFEELRDDLEKCASQVKKLDKNVQVVTVNPNSKYLMRFLGVNDSHLLWFSTDEFPDPKSAGSQLKLILEKSNAEFIVCSPDMITELTEIVASLNHDTEIQILSIELLDRPPSNGDFISGLKSNIKLLVNAIDAN